LKSRCLRALKSYRFKIFLNNNNNNNSREEFRSPGLRPFIYTLNLRMLLYPLVCLISRVSKWNFYTGVWSILQSYRHAFWVLYYLTSTNYSGPNITSFTNTCVRANGILTRSIQMTRWLLSTFIDVDKIYKKLLQ
jgi:hypothetical protein